MGTKKRWDQQKKYSKMLDSHSIISLITLSENGLNIPIKRQSLQAVYKE